MRMRNVVVFLVLLIAVLMERDVHGADIKIPKKSQACVECHRQQSAALVMEWEHSAHAQAEVSCYDCHQATSKEPDAWKHHGEWISVLVTPNDCSGCHDTEVSQFSGSHHAKAGEIIASLDNVLAEKVAGLPGNKADAVNGCWQCHGSVINFLRDPAGKIVHQGPEGRPVLDPNTWPNSGMGRLNPDGSKGSCHACHSRHDFNASLARSPENCGKCHMGPDHPQIEIYNESKHGIAFYANRNRMNLEKDGDWILGRDYSAAPTCATCHMSGFMTPAGKVVGNNHDVGERISWNLRPIVSTRMNLVEFEDGMKENYPESRPIPKVGEKVGMEEKYAVDGQMRSRRVERKVAKVTLWQARREEMQRVCANCHSEMFVDNFYKQYDDLVILYNEKFAVPAKAIMDELEKDGVLNPRSPFGTELQWIFYELWHHEGRRARHGASMMGPDYTHWHGMYEVAKHFYNKFLPKVVSEAKKHSPAMGKKYERRVADLLKQPAHRWIEGLSTKEIEELNKAYLNRYQQKQ